MLLDPRVILMFGANALLLFLALLVNSALAGWSLYLILLGPMLVFPALYLRHQSYFLATLFTGLWVDASSPAPFGLFTIGFLFAGAFIFMIRLRFRAEHNYHPVVLAHILNFYFLLLVTLAMGFPYFLTASYWLYVVVTGLLSHLLLLLVAPWFFNFERMLFVLFRMDPEPEDFPFR